MKSSENIKESDSYNFLLLSLYFYLKKNNYNQTADKLFQEGKLDSIFKFPNDLKPPTNEKEKMQNKFIEFFYKNSFNNQNFDFLGDFWDQFWNIFGNKMKNNSNKVETLFEKEKKNIIKHSYNSKNISLNFINGNSNKDNNNNDAFKSINIISNISKNSNYNNYGETEEMINMMNPMENKEKNMNINLKNDNQYLQENCNKVNIDKNISKSNPQINKNNQNYYDDEDEEEENDIEKEMDEVNDIRFNKQNSPNIIKRNNEEEMPNILMANDYDNDMNKNIFPYPPNIGLSNFDLTNPKINSNNNFERNMSAIPLIKDIGMDKSN